MGRRNIVELMSYARQVSRATSRFVTVFLAAIVAIALTGCVAAVDSDSNSGSSARSGEESPMVTALPDALEAGPYLIQPGDEISIRFYLTPELDEDIRIPPDGMLSLRLIGPIQAIGVTTEELASELETQYKRELKAPDIAVVLRKTPNNQVFVGGEVQKPQAVPYSPNMTPIEAVLHAGGFKPTAKLRHVLIIRKDETGKPVPYEVDLNRMLTGQVRNIPVQPLDIVYVPKKRIAQINEFVDSYVKRLFLFNGFNYNFDDDNNSD